MQNAPEVQVGQPAPDFRLEDENENPLRLSSLRGQPVVLIFYPFDWSDLCTEELCSVRENWTKWESSGARVLGISRDSIYSHKAWKERLDIAHTLLADLTGDVAKLYGAWNDDFYRAERMTVVIDPEGVVRYVVHNHAGKTRDHSEALKVVEEMSIKVGSC